MKSTLKRQQLAGQSAGSPSRQLRNIIFFFLFLELSFFMTSYESGIASDTNLQTAMQDDI